MNEETTQAETKKIELMYEAPKMTKHDPVKIVQGSDGYGGCSGYYYTTLYYY